MAVINDKDVPGEAAGHYTRSARARQRTAVLSMAGLFRNAKNPELTRSPMSDNRA